MAWPVLSSTRNRTVVHIFKEGDARTLRSPVQGSLSCHRHEWAAWKSLISAGQGVVVCSGACSLWKRLPLLQWFRAWADAPKNRYVAQSDWYQRYPCSPSTPMFNMGFESAHVFHRWVTEYFQTLVSSALIFCCFVSFCFSPPPAEWTTCKRSWMRSAQKSWTVKMPPSGRGRVVCRFRSQCLGGVVVLFIQSFLKILRSNVCVVDVRLVWNFGYRCIRKHKTPTRIDE